MFTVLSACVLPIGPEFDDPPAVPNYEPFFVPPIFPDPESSAPIRATVPTTFDINLSDPNPGDLLSVRWVANYPPYVSNATMLLGQSNEIPIPDSGPLTLHSPGMTCDNFSLSTEKNLVVIVSDRKFLMPELSTDRNLRYSYKDDGVSTPGKEKLPTRTLVMMGWRITGCQ